MSKITALFLIALGFSASFAYEANANFYIKARAGVWGAPTAKSFAVETMEDFGDNWSALRVPLSTARYYETLEPFFALGLEFTYGDIFFVHSEFPLRRDIEAWYQDPYKQIHTFNPSELDLNVPTDAWALWNNSIGFVKFGRFKPELFTTPNTLVLGGAPWHDAIQWHFESKAARYDFMLVSLNSWLSKKEDSLQANLTIPNARERTYTEHSKNLLLHRLGLDGGWGWIAITEQSLIGGKTLEFRDFSPFTAWHNNFSYGYSKMSTAFDGGLRVGKNSEFYWQFVLEDIITFGEKLGDRGYSTMAFLAGYKQKIPLGNYGLLESRIDAVRTDPQFNNNNIPLQKMTSRRVYNSNYREQSKPNFADMYIVDYPLGYRRGPDAIDLWWNLNYSSADKRFGAELETALLSQGSCTLYSGHDECSKKRILEGGERLFLIDLLAKYKLMKYLSVYAGAGAQSADKWAKLSLNFEWR